MSEEEAGTVIPGEIEQKAMAQGWAPQEQWKGDPEKWVDAKTFLEKGEKIQAIQRERNDHLTQQVEELRGLIVEQRDMAKKARLEGYQQALTDIEKRQIDATENADVEAFKQAKADEKKVLDKINKESSEEPAPAGPNPEWAKWVGENDWYSNDQELGEYADFVSNRLAPKVQAGELTLTAALAEVTRKVKSNFPHKFSNPRREDPSAVETGAPTPTKKKADRGYDALPDKAKSSYQKLARQFKAQGIEYTKEEYLSNYVWD